MHVYSSLHGNLESLIQARHPMMHAVQTLDIHPVADYETVEPQLIPQQIVHQPAVSVAWDAVDLVMRGHHCGHMRFFHSHLEGWQMKLAQFAFTDIHRGCIQAAERLTACNQVLGAGHHLAFGVIALAPLEPPDHILAHLRHQPWILAEGLSHAPPTGIAGNIQIWRECPDHAGLAHLYGRLRPYFLHNLRTEGGCQVDVGGVYRAAGTQAVAMNGIDAVEQRNGQAGFAGEHL